MGPTNGFCFGDFWWVYVCTEYPTSVALSFNPVSVLIRKAFSFTFAIFLRFILFLDNWVGMGCWGCGWVMGWWEVRVVGSWVWGRVDGRCVCETTQCRGKHICDVTWLVIQCKHDVTKQFSLNFPSIGPVEKSCRAWVFFLPNHHKTQHRHKTCTQF